MHEAGVVEETDDDDAPAEGHAGGGTTSARSYSRGGGDRPDRMVCIPWGDAHVVIESLMSEAIEARRTARGEGGRAAVQVGWSCGGVLRCACSPAGAATLIRSAGARRRGWGSSWRS